MNATRTASQTRRPRTPLTPHDRCQRAVTRLAELTGDKWTLGYIGNCDRHFDDRAWYAFGPVGAKIGGHRTEDLDKLALVLSGAVALAHSTSTGR